MNDRPRTERPETHEQQKAQRGALAQATQQDRVDLRELMGTEGGRRYVWRILLKCKVFDESFHPNALQMAAIAGNRDIGVWLLGEMQGACYDLYLKMETEVRNAAIEAANTKRKGV